MYIQILARISSENLYRISLINCFQCGKQIFVRATRRSGIISSTGDYMTGEARAKEDANVSRFSVNQRQTHICDRVRIRENAFIAYRWHGNRHRHDSRRWYGNGPRQLPAATVPGAGSDPVLG